MIAAHALLAGAGAWQADEYYNFALLRHLGGWFWWQRVLHWSPRPMSELVLAGYAGLVDWLHRPLIGPFLLGCWLLLAWALLAGWWRRGMRWADAALPLCVFALFLLGHPVSEMFYWPMAAAPYLLCLAGLAFVTLREVRGGPAGWAWRLSTAGALLAAAWCAELGGVAALCLCPVLMALEGRGAGRLWRMACWAVPMAAGAAVIWLVAQGRVANLADGPEGGSALFHELWPSVRAAAGTFASELSGGGSWWARAGLVLAFAGFAAWPRGAAGEVSRSRLLALAAALLATAYVSLVAAYYQFGRLCCERHATFRQCLMLLALLALAVWVRKGQGGMPLRFPAGPMLLVCAMALGLPGRVGDLAHDYRAAPAMLAARRSVWRPSAGPLPVQLPPLGLVVAPRGWIGPGRYEAAGGQPWFVSGLMLFFDRTSLQVQPPRQPGG